MISPKQFFHNNIIQLQQAHFNFLHFRFIKRYQVTKVLKKEIEIIILVQVAQAHIKKHSAQGRPR